MQIVNHEIKRVKIKDLKFDESNPNELTQDQMEGLKKSLEEYGDLRAIVIDQNNMICDGAHRALVYKQVGMTDIPAYRIKFDDEIQRKMLRQILNKLHGEHEPKLDAEELALIYQHKLLPELSALIGQNQNELKRLIVDYHPESASALISIPEDLEESLILPNEDGTRGFGSLAQNFGIPPFSIHILPIFISPSSCMLEVSTAQSLILQLHSRFQQMLFL